MNGFDVGCCPKCLSRFRDIHGMVYPSGSHEGTPCENDWHKGPDYDPSILVLTVADKALLKLARIKV